MMRENLWKSKYAPKKCTGLQKMDSLLIGFISPHRILPTHLGKKSRKGFESSEKKKNPEMHANESLPDSVKQLKKIRFSTGV